MDVFSMQSWTVIPITMLLFDLLNWLLMTMHSMIYWHQSNLLLRFQNTGGVHMSRSNTSVRFVFILCPHASLSRLKMLLYTPVQLPQVASHPLRIINTCIHGCHKKFMSTEQVLQLWGGTETLKHYVIMMKSSTVLQPSLSNHHLSH